MDDAVHAYHFVGATLRDGSPVPPDGVKLIFPGPPIICEAGLHASIDPFDALNYAPGPVLCLVEVGGTIIKSDDKLVSTERTIIARLDARELLRYFARMTALSVINNWLDPVPEAVLDWLMTGHESKQRSVEDAATLHWLIGHEDLAFACAVRAAAKTAAYPIEKAALFVEEYTGQSAAFHAIRHSKIKIPQRKWDRVRAAKNLEARRFFCKLIKESLHGSHST